MTSNHHGAEGIKLVHAKIVRVCFLHTLHDYSNDVSFTTHILMNSFLTGQPSDILLLVKFNTNFGIECHILHWKTYLGLNALNCIKGQNHNGSAVCVHYVLNPTCGGIKFKTCIECHIWHWMNWITSCGMMQIALSNASMCFLLLKLYKY